MNILFIAGQPFFPLDQGARIRNYYLLKNLAQYHQIQLICLVRSKAELLALSNLKAHCSAIHPVFIRRGALTKIRDLIIALFSRTPYTVLANSSGKLRAKVSEVLDSEQIDIVHLAELYPGVNLRGLSISCPLIFDAHNCEGLIYRRLEDVTKSWLKRSIYRHQGNRMKHLEREICGRADSVFCVSPKELEYFKTISRKAVLVPNGVPDVAQEHSVRGTSILFTGTLSYPPNEDAVFYFLEEIWPLIRRSRPESEFVIIGRGASKKLRRFKGAGVRVLADVPDITPYFKSAALLVVPLRAGAGTRLKILQAFSFGLPVVSTGMGAEGLNVEDERELLLRESPQSFAEGVVEILNSPERGAELATAAAELVLREYLWSDISKLSLNSYESLFE